MAEGVGGCCCHTGRLDGEILESRLSVSVASDRCMFPVPVTARLVSSAPSSSLPVSLVLSLQWQNMLLTSQTLSPVTVVQAGKAVEPVTDFLPGSTHEIRSILIIQNAELEDSGTYICNVSEGYHEKMDRKDITIHVIGALLPTRPKLAKHVGVQTGCPRVTLSSPCTASSPLPSSLLP